MSTQDTTAMRGPRLYTVFALVRDDTEESMIAEDVCMVDALRTYRERRDTMMRKHGFHVREWIDEVDNMLSCQVENLLTGQVECNYWIRETA